MIVALRASRGQSQKASRRRVHAIFVELRVRAQRERYRELVSAVVERGVRLGEFATPDVGIAALGLLGMCNWVAQWYRPGGRLSAGEIGGYFADLVLDGLKRDQSLEPNTSSPTVSPSARTSAVE